MLLKSNNILDLYNLRFVFCIGIYRFSAALQKDKPNTLNALIRKTAQELSSPSSFALNLPTPQQDHVTEKWNAHKEKLKW